MDNKKISRVRGKDGKFCKKSQSTIRVAVCLLPETHQKLIDLVPEDGTISDVLRDAIAEYLERREPRDRNPRKRKGAS